MGACARARFVIDEEGVIRWSEIYPAAINPGVGGILTALESMVCLPPVEDEAHQH